MVSLSFGRTPAWLLPGPTWLTSRGRRAELTQSTAEERKRRCSRELALSSACEQAAQVGGKTDGSNAGKPK